MIILWIIIGVIVVSVGLAAWYDHRAKQRGWRPRAFGEDAFQHRMDVKSQEHNPMAQGGKQDWMTWRQGGQK